MPIWAKGDPTGPIENGTTYIVRPVIEPWNSPVRSAFILAGSRQLFVGPASASLTEQMKVRSSTRATSPGCDVAQKLFGRFASDNGVNVPAATSRWQKSRYSSAEPSHHSTRSGVVRAEISSTQAMSLG